MLENQMKAMADYSVELFDMDDELLPTRMRSTIRWILYSAMPFFLNIAYFGLVMAAMLVIEAKYGEGRILALIAALMIFGALRQPSKD